MSCWNVNCLFLLHYADYITSFCSKHYVRDCCKNVSNFLHIFADVSVFAHVQKWLLYDWRCSKSLCIMSELTAHCSLLLSTEMFTQFEEYFDKSWRYYITIIDSELVKTESHFHFLHSSIILYITIKILFISYVAELYSQKKKSLRNVAAKVQTLKKSSAQKNSWIKLYVWCECVCSYTSSDQILHIQLYRIFRLIIVWRKDHKLETLSLIITFNVLQQWKKRYYLISEQKTRTDFEQSSKKKRFKKYEHLSEESSIKIILLQSQSVLINEFRSLNVDDLIITFSVHLSVQFAVAELKKKWKVN